MLLLLNARAGVHLVTEIEESHRSAVWVVRRWIDRRAYIEGNQL
jgi:hypothetical protein